MGVYENLSKIQEELFVPKGQRNDFGKYNYRSCEDILQAVKPICAAYGCVCILDSIVEEINGKNYVIAKAILRDLEDNSEVQSTAAAREDDVLKGMTSSQISGSTLSYARKYALAGLFCIDNEKDADTRQNFTTEDVAKIKVEALKALEKKSDEYRNNVLEHYKVTSPAQLSPDQCKELLEKIKKG